MQIVLDTNAIYRDYYLERPATVAFLQGLERIPAKLLVPEIVVDEMVNHFRRDLETALKQFSDAGEQISSRLRAASVSTGPNLSVAREVDKYREALLARIEDFEGEVLPYPRTTHKELVARDLAGKKPFDQNSRGYRDALIWEAVRSKTWGGHERVVFVTDNSTDFGKAPDLHDDLRREILNPERLSLAASLKEVNATWILPKMQMLEDVRRELEAHSSGQVDLLAWLKSQLLGILSGEDETFASLVPWSPANQISAHPGELVELKELRVLSVRPLAGDEVLVRLQVRADIDVCVSWRDYGFLGRRGWMSGERNASTNILREFSVGLDLVLDRKRGEVVAAEVAMMGNEYETVDYGSWTEPGAHAAPAMASAPPPAARPESASQQITDA